MAMMADSVVAAIEVPPPSKRVCQREEVEPGERQDKNNLKPSRDEPCEAAVQLETAKEQQLEDIPQLEKSTEEEVQNEPVLESKDDQQLGESEDIKPQLENRKDENLGAGKFAKRKKVILLLSYCGQGYMGMQKNPGVRTIEEDLLEAMCKAKAFPPEMKTNLGQLKFQRCARTDKGVSAARQVVSLKIS